jgi:hypothetical protein
MGLSGEGNVVSGAMTNLLHIAVRNKGMGKHPKKVLCFVWRDQGLRALKRIGEKLE